MNLLRYLKDKAVVLLMNAAALFFLDFYIYNVGISNASLWLITMSWLFVLLIYLGVDYIRVRKRMKYLYGLLDHLEKKYLLGEVMERGDTLADEVYRDLLKKSNRSVIETIHDLERQHQDYKEYMEGWIHEVKTPITAIQLICENQKDEASRKIQMELGRIEDQVENVLYFARSDAVYQDYLIHEVNLKEVVLSAISRSKRYFIQAGMQVRMEVEDSVLPTDDKWVLFLLNQFFKNAIQYRCADQPVLTIRLLQTSEQTVLVLEDNGIGIPEDEIDRIFDKGFTGSNGRLCGQAFQSIGNTESKATGIGLYLCKKLCDQMELGLQAQSVEGQYTRILVTFPHSTHQKI